LAKTRKPTDSVKPKHAGGRPRLFKSPEELEAAIIKYFNGCIKKKKNPGICALALALGFETKQSIYDCEKIPEFSYLIKRARLCVESSYESRLNTISPTGAIFALKNMGWHDKSETLHTFPETIKVEFV
jgi:hypothetical protein